MSRAVFVSCLCALLASGCSYNNGDGKWRKSNAHEAAMALTRGQLANAKIHCDKIIDLVANTQCVQRIVEPQEHLVNELKSNRNENEVIPRDAFGRIMTVDAGIP